MSNPLVAQIIQGARDLIADPACWTRCNLAVTADYESCDPWQPEAVRFCAHGALLKTAFAMTGDHDTAWHFAHSAAVSVLSCAGIVNPDAPGDLFAINDDQGHEAVLALFDKALIASAS